MPKPRLVFIHDGAVDEYMATVLLATLEGWDLAGIIITNADCIGGPAMQAAWKLQTLLGRTDIPLALSAARAVNPFPWSFRADCIGQAEIDLLAPIPQNTSWPRYPLDPATHGMLASRTPQAPPGAFPSGEDLLESLLAAAVRENAPLTVLATSPLPPLQLVLQASPLLAAGVARLVWMGGSFETTSNSLWPVPPEAASPLAEWNAFWDPHSVDWLLRHTTFPIFVVPIKLTRQAPLTSGFMTSLQQQSGQGCALSTLAYQSYATVFPRESSYAFWDVLTACFLPKPELFAPPTTRTVQIITEGFYQGAFLDNPGGREINVLSNLIDPAAFYAYVLERFGR